MRSSIRCMAVVVCAAWAGWWLAAPAPAQQAKEDLTARSRPLRTALHHDPTLASPLEQLLSMYRSAGRADELVGMYRSHVAQYPADVSGRTVLVRLLAATSDPGVARVAQEAAQQFPQNAYLRFLLFEILRAKQDPGALDQLDRAIELEERPARKLAWIDVLLPAAEAQGRRDLAEKHLTALAAKVDEPDDRLEVARRMIEQELHEPALALLEKETAAPPAPETMVSIELEAAAAEVGLGRNKAAGARLDRLLARLTADYWRRAEIVRRRLAVVASEAEREAIIGAARQRVAQDPRDEAAVLDLAQVLAGLQRRRDALEVLFEAGRRLPNSAPIEKRTLELLDLLRDFHAREEFLAGRIKQQPQRPDLVLLHVKTLYLLGRSDGALSELTELCKGMEPGDRATHLLEMARFLRRSMLTEEAAGLLERVVALKPARLDVRRELAETCLATGDRRRLRELFQDIPAKKANLENLLDVVQFMLEQGLLREAQTAVSARLEDQPENLDLRLLLVGIERRLGNLDAGEKLIDETRALADTAARYRLWLETAVLFHEEFDTVDGFFEAEQLRLAQDPREWTSRRLERRLAFVEIAARSGLEEKAVAMLESDLSGDLPEPFRVRLRRQLVATLEKQPALADSVQKELEQLAQEDPENRDLYHARLALLYAKQQRHDLALALLEQIDVARIPDAAVLSALRPLYAEQPEGGKRVLRLLERLTVLNPADRNNWQQWLTALAMAGEETRLRTALRQLLAGVEKMPLSAETRALLESHLADSYWRDVGRCVADERESSLADALVYLDAVEPVAQSDQQWLWITWIRAYLLDRLGRTEARDEAIEELGRVAEKIAPPAEGAAESGDPGSPPSATVAEVQGPRIAFPDGLSISLEHARKLLSHSAPRHAPRPGERQGPLPRFGLKWAYDTQTSGLVTAIVPLGAEHMLICDAQGQGHCLETETGKLLWQRAVAPPLPSPDNPYASGNLQQAMQQIQMYQQVLAQLPASQRAQMAVEIQQALQTLLAQLALPSQPLADGQGRFYVPGPSQVSCYAVEDGRLLWRAEVGSSKPSPPGTMPKGSLAATSVFLYGEHLLTFEPASGTVTKIDPNTGKIVWYRTYAPDQPALVGWHNSGASLCADRLLIYGTKTAVVDLASGEVEWSFEPWRVRKFPVDLRDPDAQPITTVVSTSAGYPASPYPTPWYGRYSVGAFVGSPRYVPPAQPTQYVSYLQPSPSGGPSYPSSLPFAPPPGGVSLTGPAIVWASQIRQGSTGYGCLLERRLLLLDESGLQIVPTDLPLSGKRVDANGQLIGLAGRIACLLSGGQLQFVDVTDGSVKYSDIQEIATGSALVPIQAAVDGPQVYVAGPGGILSVNAITGRRVFRADWPDEIASPAPPRPAIPSIPPGMAVLHGSRTIPSPYYSGGHLVYAPSAYPPASTAAYPIAFPSGLPGAHVPPIGRVDRGVFYVLAGTSRVVALSEQPNDGK